MQRKQLNVKRIHLGGHEKQGEDLTDVMKSRSHRQAFGSSLYFTLWYKALLSPILEQRTNIADDHDESRAEGEKNENVKKLPVLEVETFVLHHTRSVGSYQQKMATKWAVHTSFAINGVHFR